MVKKCLLKPPKKCLLLGGQGLKLTPKQKQILDIITTSNLTPKQIAQRRGITKQALYRILRELKKKGVLSKMFTKSNAPSNTSLYTKPKDLNTPKQGIRLHGEEFNIKILSQKPNYQKIKAQGNIIKIDNNTIRLYNGSIEVYSGQSFMGKDVQEANFKAIAYWNRLFIRLENLLNITILKDRKNNIKKVKEHYADINNEIATECEKTGDKLQIKDQKDNKVAYLVDNSWNLKEFESIHPQKAKQDMEKAEKHFHDWRNNNPPTNSEIMTLIKELALSQKDTSNSLLAVIKLITPPNYPKEDVPKGKIDYIG
jgi:predicted DNA-binding protein YlxM (UPF0122 family)